MQSMNENNVHGNNYSNAIPWIVRIVSAIFTYFGLIYYLDRPRGELYLPLVPKGVDNAVDGVLQVQPSNFEDAGLGLFVTQPLQKGTVLGTYPGIVVELQPHISKLNQHPQCEAYIWRFSDNKYVIDPTNSVGILDETCVGGSPTSFLSEWFFQTINSNANGNDGVPTVLCRINEPPRGYDVNVITTENIDQRTVTFELERDVLPNEELFIDYGLSYDRSNYQ